MQDYFSHMKKLSFGGTTVEIGLSVKGPFPLSPTNSEKRYNVFAVTPAAKVVSAMDTVSGEDLPVTSLKHARFISSELEQLSQKSLAMKIEFDKLASKIEKGEVQLKD